MNQDIKKWWEETSDSYQKSSKIGTGSAHYGPFAPDESELKLLGNVKGKKILEVGCGGGQCSIAFAKQGAKCIGIDISGKQLNYAKKLAEVNKVKAKFIQGDFQDLRMIKSGSMDIVFSAYALHYAHDLNKIFKEINRVLKKKGKFVFSFDHPFYLVVDPGSKKIRESYLDTGRKVLVDTWDDKTKHKFVYYKRKISDIYNSLIKNKFQVEEIIEPLSLKDKRTWATGAWKKIYPISMVKLIGPTIIFSTIKE